MHVLYVIGGKGLRYGAEVVAENLIENLKKEYKVQFTVIINARGVISELCERLNIEYHVVRTRPYVYAKHGNKCIDVFKRKMLLARAVLEDEIAVRKLEKVIDFSKIDIVHTNLSRNMLGVRLANRHKIPHIWHIQEMFDAHYKLNFLMKDQLAYMNQHSDAFIGISNTVSRDWINNGLSKDKTYTVLNGIDETERSKRKSQDVYKLVMIAEITPPKGQEFVIDAISRLSVKERMQITLDFIGGGKDDYVAYLKNKVKRNGLDSRVIFWGHKDNASNMLKNYDILINASDGEGFGLSTAEAMMNGICPLVSDRGANLELVKDRVTGVVFFMSGGYENFLDSLKYLLNDVVIEEISSNAYAYAVKHFTVKRQVREIYDVYQSLI